MRSFTMSNSISSHSTLNSSSLTNNPRATATTNSLNNLNTARTPHSPATAPTLLPSRATASNSTMANQTTISTVHRLTPSSNSSTAVPNTAPPPIPRAALQDNTLPASPAPTVTAV